ncbi:MAG: hypothetical protein Q9227_004409 [Pyrenula ochraceoflavens]
MHDEEKQANQPNFIGYANVAAFATSDKEHSATLFRRFESLSARNLLYLQSELRELEAQQSEIDRVDAANADDPRADPEDTDVATDWQFLRKKAEISKEPKAMERLQLAKNIRAKLEEYESALLRNAALNKLDRPTQQVFRAFRTHFHNQHLENPQYHYPRLTGFGADLYDKEYYNDIVSLGNRSEQEDRLTTFLRHRHPKRFMRKTEDEVLGSPSVRSMSEYRLQVFVGALNILLAASFLFGSIFNLYYVKSPQKRLGLISGYTIAFAVCVSLTTNARKAEVFGSCAAYAAVLVVFVSGNL